MDTAQVEERKFNPGICLLKLIACFGVVNSHFGAHGGELITLPVPMFIFVSMFVGYGGIAGGAIAGRAKRLLFPFWAWGLFYFVAYCMFTHSFELDKLAWQLTFGHSVCKPLFFLPLLFFYTILVYGVTHLGKYKEHAFWTLILVSFAMQYSGLNYAIFGSFPEEMRFTCGRVFECLPAVCAACLIKEHECMLDKFKRQDVIAFFAVSLVAYYFVATNRLIPRGVGFTKQGFSLFLGTVLVSSAFIFIGRMARQVTAKSLLMRFSSLSFGIYLLHVIVARFYEFAFGRQDNYVESVTIFIASAVAVAVMSKIPYVKEFVK